MCVVCSKMRVLSHLGLFPLSLPLPCSHLSGEPLYFLVILSRAINNKMEMYDGEFREKKKQQEEEELAY